MTTTKPNTGRIVALGAVFVVAVLGTIGVSLASTDTAVPGLAFGGSGDAAVWNLDAAALPTIESTSFTVDVTRIDCNNGETGRTLDPEVDYRPDAIVITIGVEEAEPGPKACPGNRAEPTTVELDEAVGRRMLVDGACESEETASTSTHCTPRDGVRWTPAGPVGVTVTGHLQFYAPPGEETFPVVGDVRVLDEAGRPIATTATDTQGAFVFDLPNGSYELVTEPAARGDGSRPQCGDPKPIAVVGEPIEGIDVVCLA